MPIELNQNFSKPVAVTNSLQELATDNPEVVLEQTPQHRKTSFVFLGDGESINPDSYYIEILVLEGSCKYNNNCYKQGHYLRLPDASSLTGGTGGCKLFVKFRQFLPGDTAERVIETQTKERWLPGPADGIKIRPLHVFDTESIMLLRWEHAAEFRPNLDPQGEELLVISGLLQNKDHLFRPYSWLRNPVEDWRSWHGSTNTLVYYKSGHFPDTDSATPELATPDTQ